MHKDGHAVWLSWLGTWSAPVKRFFFVGRDMTESRQVQEALRESAQLARGIIDTIVGSLRVSRRFDDWTFYAGYLIQLANISKDVLKPLAGSEGGWVNRGGGVVSDLTGLVEIKSADQQHAAPFERLQAGCDDSVVVEAVDPVYLHAHRRREGCCFDHKNLPSYE